MKRTYSSGPPGIRRACGLAALLSLAALMTSPGALGAPGNLMFAAPFIAYDVGRPPGSVAAGDLDGDGMQDLVVAYFQLGGIAVLIGKGDWMFESPVSYLTPADGYDPFPSPNPVEVTDLNGDGAPDVVVLIRDANDISVFPGIGNGALGPRADYATGGGADFMTIGDVSGDGHADLVVTNDVSGTVSILLGNGDGTFGASTDYASPPHPKAVAIGDLNRDGLADLAVTAWYCCPDVPGSVSVLPGTGGGAFGPAIWSAPSGTARPNDIRIGDLNGDGNLDLVVAGSQVSVFLGDGSGSFATPTTYDCPGGSLLVTDLNGDGRLDVALGGLWVMLGNGDGTLGACTHYYAGLSASWPVLADLNGDGRQDIVVANRYKNPDIPYSLFPPGTVSMLAGHGDGTFGEPVSQLETGDGPSFVAMRDLNGDGRMDLVTANSGAGTVSALLGDGHGGFGAKADFATGSQPASVAIDDLNRDGKLDLAVANAGSNTVSVLLGAGDGAFGPKTDFAAGNRPVSVAIGDFNRDGSPDLAIANRNWVTVSVLLGSGNGTFAQRLEIPFTYVGYPSSVAVGDLNLDGASDLAVSIFGQYDMFTSSAVAVWRGNGDGTFPYPDVYTAGSDPSFVAIGDLNLDGRPDLAVACAGSVSDYGWDGPGSVAVLKGNSDGTFTRTGSWTVGDYPTSLVIQDFDGDDKPDVAVSSSHSPRVSVFLGRGDGTLGSRLDYGATNTVSSVTSGDLDGDGRPDLALAIAAADRVMLLRNVTPDWPTPTLLSLFHGARSARGVELRWQFGDPAAFASVAVERGESAEGPWRGVEGERREEGGTSVLLDRSAEPGRTYFYRLLAVRTGGGPMIFGPLEVTAGATAGGLALLPVAPNPSHDRVRIGFAVAHPTHVRLAVLDVQGRHVARLVDEERAPGSYEVAWDGRTEAGLAPAGLYFVRYEAAGVLRVQRFVLTR